MSRTHDLEISLVVASLPTTGRIVAAFVAPKHASPAELQKCLRQIAEHRGEPHDLTPYAAPVILDWRCGYGKRHKRHADPSRAARHINDICASKRCYGLTVSANGHTTLRLLIVRSSDSQRILGALAVPFGAARAEYLKPFERFGTLQVAETFLPVQLHWQQGNIQRSRTHQSARQAARHITALCKHRSRATNITISSQPPAEERSPCAAKPAMVRRCHPPVVCCR